MRRAIKDGMGRVFQRPATHTIYYTKRGNGFTVDNETHIVVVASMCPEQIEGREVYASKGRLIDVETGRVLVMFNRSRRITINGLVTKAK